MPGLLVGQELLAGLKVGADRLKTSVQKVSATAGERALLRLRGSPGIPCKQYALCFSHPTHFKNIAVARPAQSFAPGKASAIAFVKHFLKQQINSNWFRFSTVQKSN